MNMEQWQREGARSRKGVLTRGQPAATFLAAAARASATDTAPPPPGGQPLASTSTPTTNTTAPAPGSGSGFGRLTLGRPAVVAFAHFVARELGSARLLL